MDRNLWRLEVQGHQHLYEWKTNQLCRLLQTISFNAITRKIHLLNGVGFYDKERKDESKTLDTLSIFLAPPQTNCFGYDLCGIVRRALYSGTII